MANGRTVFDGHSPRGDEDGLPQLVALTFRRDWRTGTDSRNIRPNIVF